MRYVECDSEHELYFACKLISAEHNQRQELHTDYTREWIEETELMEQAAREFQDATGTLDDDSPGLSDEAAMDAGWKNTSTCS